MSETLPLEAYEMSILMYMVMVRHFLLRWTVERKMQYFKIRTLSVLQFVQFISYIA